MKYKMSTFLGIFLLPFFSCETKECCVEVDTGILILLENQKGENLFVESNQNFIDPTAVRLSYFINGAPSKIWKGNLDVLQELVYKRLNKEVKSLKLLTSI
jgi:hypothetical protein